MNRWALLVGINQYPNFAPRGQLKGCVNDVQVMRRILIDSFSFPEANIALLIDEQATREAILAAMQELVARVQEGDVVVFHYSGHGSQMPDVEGDEPDGIDETIVPYDSGRKPHENRDIKDDEIYLWLVELTAKTSTVTVILDCCHSGTAVRGIPGPGEEDPVEVWVEAADHLPEEDPFEAAVRWVEADDRLPSPLPPEACALLGVARDLGPSGWLPLGERYVLLAGCNRGERSAEIEQPAGNRHGALTFFLAQALREARSGTTYRDIYEAIAPQVSARFPNQHPQLEGTRDREIFGVRTIAPVPFVPVVRRSGAVVQLGAGAVCGLSQGSRWAIHAAGTKAVPLGEEPIGEVLVTAVRAVTSEGRIVQEIGPEAVTLGMRAVERAHAVESRLPIEVVTPPGRDDQARELLDDIGGSKLLRLAAQGEAARVRVHLLAARSTVTECTPVPGLGALSAETWVAVGADGELSMPAHRRDEPAVAQLLVENLERIARFQLALSLRNPASGLAGKVKAELLRWVDGAPVEPELGAGSEVIFHEFDRAVLRVVHEHSQPLFIYVLDLGLSGRIYPLYPVVGASESLPPRCVLEVGKRQHDEKILAFPADYPFRDPGTETIEGMETWKLFATTHPTDFHPLLQGAVREHDSPAGPVSALGELLAVTFDGGGCRDVLPPGETEDWIALERSFRLRRSRLGRIAAR